MRVLHFIPNLKAVAGSSFLGYKAQLIAALADKADVTVLTRDAGHTPLGKAEIRTFSTADMLAMKRKRFFSKALDSLRPDVVHIHACWNKAADTLSKECARRSIPTVMTVDRRLEAWHVRQRYWSHKLPKMLLFQRSMLSRVGALHFLSSNELSSFETFGWHPCLKPKRSLNERTAVIEPFNITAGTSAEAMADATLALYSKVADSAPFFQMTADERKAEDILLAAGMAAGHPDLATPGEDGMSLLRSLDGKAWRRIFIHAHDEGISDYIKAGAEQAGIRYPETGADTIDRFRMHAGSKHAGKDFAKSKKISKLKSDAALPDFERVLCAEFAVLIMKIRHSCAHRSDFARIYGLLRFNEYDEDSVRDRLHGMGFGKDAARVLQVMEERYDLGEGFMFADPLDDNGTRKLRQKLFKSEIQ